MSQLKLLLIFFFTSFGVFAQWTPLNGPFDNQISYDSRVMAIDANNIFVAVSGSRGIFKTSDNGQHWQQFNIGLPINLPGGCNINVISLIGNYVFIYSSQGIFRSQITNCNWELLSTPFPNNYYENMCTNGTQIFASTTNGLYVSLDYGISWTLNPATIGSYISALNYDNGVLYVIRRTLANGNIFSKSTDNGITWIDTINNLGTGVFKNMIISNNKIFISSGGVYKSDDGGTTWTLSGVGNFTINSMFKSGSKIYALGPIWNKVTDNDGLTWTDLYSSCTCVRNYGFSYGDRIVLGDYSSQTSNSTVPIYFSLNTGNTWNIINQNLVNESIVNLELINNKIVVENNNNVSMYSNDNGFDWNISNGKKYLKNNGTLLFTQGSTYSSSTGLTTNNMYSSVDGISWNLLNTLNLPQPCTGFADSDPCGVTSSYKLLKVNGNEIYIGANYYYSQGYNGYKVFRTVDNGASWSLFISSGAAIVDLVIGTGVSYAITNYNVYKTLDNGNTWIDVRPSAFSNRINCIARDNNNLYIGTGIWGGTPTGQGIFKSTDEGLTWVLINNGLSTFLTKQIYTFGGNLFAITTNYNNSVGHIFMSIDSGVNWSEISSTELNNAVPSILRFYNNNIYCATENNGIWKNSSIPLGLENNNINFLDGIKLYPNPTFSNISINLGIFNNFNYFSYSIYNQLGQKIIEGNLTGEETTLPLNEYINNYGIYFIKLINKEDNSFITRKIIFNKK